MNNDQKKRRSFKEYFASSAIVTFLMWIAGFVYQKASSGFFGKLFTSYDRENKAATESLSYSLSKRVGYGEKIAYPIKKTIAREFEQSRILGAISYFADTFLYSAQKVHGVFLVSFGLYIEIVYFIKLVISQTGIESADMTPVLIGAVLMMMSLPLIFSNQTLAEALCESKLGSFLLFTVISAKKESFTKDIKRKDHLYTPFIAGMVLGLLTIAVPPTYIILGIVGIIGVYTILCIPEFGILTIITLTPFISLSPLPPSMALVGLTIFVCFAFALKLIRGKRTIKYSLNDFMITLFTIMTLLGGFVSPDPSGSLKPALVYTVFLFGYFLCANFICTKKWLNKCLFALCASLFAVSALGVFQYTFGMGDSTWLDTTMFTDIEGRVVSTFENPNVLAEYIIMVLPLSFALMAGAKGKYARAGGLVCLAASTLCLVFTWSRGAWLGFIFSILVLLLMYSKKIFAVMLSLVVFVPFLPFVLPDSIINRFSSIGNLADTSTSYRVNIWSGVTRMLEDYWLTGIGTGNPAFSQVYPAYSLSGIETAPHAHNLFLQILTEHGIVTLILFLVIIFFYVQSVFTFAKYQTGSERYVPIALMCGIFAILVQGLTDYVWYNYRVYLLFWIIIGLTTAARRCQRITRI